jgi:hypothetical protein
MLAIVLVFLLWPNSPSHTEPWEKHIIGGNCLLYDGDQQDCYDDSRVEVQSPTVPIFRLNEEKAKSDCDLVKEGGCPKKLINELVGRHREGPDWRCALVYIPQGKICIDGIISDPLHPKAEAHQLPDRCQLFDIRPGTICKNGIIVKSLLFSKELAAPDRCTLLDILQGGTCVGGIFASDNPEVPYEEPVFDPCIYKEVGVNVTCVRGTPSRLIDFIPLKPAKTEEPDSWEQRQELIAIREEIIKAVERVRASREFLQYRELGAYLALTWRQMEKRINLLHDFPDGSDGLPFAALEAFTRWALLPFETADEIKKVQEAYDKKKAELAKEEARLLQKRKEAEDAVAKIEREEEGKQRNEKIARDEKERQERNALAQQEKERQTRNEQQRQEQNKNRKIEEEAAAQKGMTERDESRSSGMGSNAPTSDTSTRKGTVVTPPDFTVIVRPAD